MVLSALRLNLPDVDKIIFFFEALCVCAAIHWVAANLSPAHEETCYDLHRQYQHGRHLQFPQSLADLYPILKSTVNVLISHAIDLRVLHIPGSENDVGGRFVAFPVLKGPEFGPSTVNTTFQASSRCAGGEEMLIDVTPGSRQRVREP